jgi:hypothetical protein
MKDNYLPGGEEMFFISLQKNKNSEKAKTVIRKVLGARKAGKRDVAVAKDGSKMKMAVTKERFLCPQTLENEGGGHKR